MRRTGRQWFFAGIRMSLCGEVAGDMNIVWIDGGLGNQMFQYALALKMQSLGIQAKIDVTKYAQHHVHNDFELDRVFGINGPYAEASEIRRLGYTRGNHWTEFLKKTPFRKRTIYNNESYVYDEQVLRLDGCYIEGYWQSEKYFLDIREKIVETYRFPKLPEQLHVWEERIRNSCAVSMHIRRGDYLRFPYLQNICTVDYYRRSMDYFRESLPEMPVFYIFTNDPSWAEAHFQGKDCYFVKGNTGTDSFRDMQLMSLCRHHIVANSSFSWWGAWLGQNPDKVVIAPERWVNLPEDGKTDVIPEDWVTVKG